jgi:uncharacterized protein
VRVVFDTNVLLAAFLTEGLCSKLLSRARKSQFSLITCPFILGEVERNLKKKFSASTDQIKNVLNLITEAAYDRVEPSETISGVCRDKDDDHVLACALEAKADYLVTGDGDLLMLKKFHKTRIVTPREFESFFMD